MKKQRNLTQEQIIQELKAPIKYIFDGKESDFEENIIENIDQICEGLELPKIKVIDRQHVFEIDDFKIIPDIIVKHIDDTFTVFEVKKKNGKNPSTSKVNQMNAVGQLLLYGNVLNTITNAKIRLALIDNKIFYRTYCAFLNNNLPITLIDFQKDRVFIPYNGWNYGW